MACGLPLEWRKLLSSDLIYESKPEVLKYFTEVGITLFPVKINQILELLIPQIEIFESKFQKVLEQWYKCSDFIGTTYGTYCQLVKTNKDQVIVPFLIPYHAIYVGSSVNYSSDLKLDQTYQIHLSYDRKICLMQLLHSSKALQATKK